MRITGPWLRFAIAVLHLGRALCGHDGIIHGGLIATIFDETLARNVSAHTISLVLAISILAMLTVIPQQALLNLQSHIGVTASITINFKSPCTADQVSRGADSSRDFHQSCLLISSDAVIAQFVILRTKLESITGRKIWVAGSMETLEGVKVADARSVSGCRLS